MTGCGGGGGSDDGDEPTTVVEIYEVTTSVSGNGTITPDSENVRSGQTATFNLTPDNSYVIESATGCGGNLDGHQFTTSAITEDCVVTVRFAYISTNPQGLTAQAGDSKITLAWDPVAEATSYNLYYATEAGIEPDNYASFDNGQMIQDVSSPHNLTELDNGTEYFLVITAIVNGGESDASEEVNATPSVPVISNQLNDTGIDWCANAENSELECPIQNFPTQDAQVGRDAEAKAGTLAKVGSGAAGFDFTKLDENGNELEATAIEWDCVRDNVTGLIWEVKTLEGLNAANSVYSWYNPDATTNGGDAGVQNGGSCVGSDCDTYAYREAINAAGWCGADDWRLPTLVELQSITHRGVSRPAIDTDYFPNTTFFHVWTSSPFADTDHAWSVNFDAGVNTIWPKSGGAIAGVRLVRTGSE